ncbi:hypothetical protein N7462_009212 [Penicillium macrosclerotiorum]|uniref:uncharacterized protein n=1 Tax=Penicillium macrosclerotiorum TaxID=303699 RepID=UPI002546FD20|nr:uncharacterized protein N7462_009212 [Penicillium macrosclerotiorum]KAJ5673773.1 hypothetical protein N7462_009212 [Penicillium macrosclerotiorum]
MARTIAVAGATGSVGRTITEQILNENKFSVIALTRRDPERILESAISNVQYVQVDYDNILNLAQQLDEHAVHTVICAIGMLGDDCSEAQLNIIKAADQAYSVQRFITSEFGYMTHEGKRHIDPGVGWFLEAADLLKKTNLTYTRPVCGAFMDFLGAPHMRSNIPPIPIAVDVLNREAYIPGDGNAILTMIYSYDAATFIAKLLELDDWPEISYCAGEDITFNQVVQLAEEVCGEKFKVINLNAENIDKGDIPLLKAHEEIDIPPEEIKAYNVFGYQLYLAGAFHLPSEGRVGDRFPEFETKTVSEFLNLAWGSRT